ncbi:MAG: hypothetical protein MJZ31_06600 [Bacteroidales bacterium]|nr:hypothetical protein [Bacteroidales bacterium]
MAKSVMFILTDWSSIINITPNAPIVVNVAAAIGRIMCRLASRFIWSNITIKLSIIRLSDIVMPDIEYISI